MGSASMNWFSAAIDDDTTRLQKYQKFNTFDELQDAPKKGFAAIHYSAYFQSRQSLKFLIDQEKNCLTKQPSKFILSSRQSAEIILPPGLNFQHILALISDFGFLQNNITKMGVLQTNIPLLSILVIVGNHIFIRNNIDKLIQSLEYSTSILANPLYIACITGEKSIIDLFSDLQSEYEIIVQFQDLCYTQIENYSTTFEFHALKPLFKGFLEMENCKEVMKRSRMHSRLNSALQTPLMRSFVIE